MQYFEHRYNRGTEKRFGVFILEYSVPLRFRFQSLLIPGCSKFGLLQSIMLYSAPPGPVAAPDTEMTVAWARVAEPWPIGKDSTTGPGGRPGLMLARAP